MSQDAREQARHNASVMIAFAEGKEIQFRFNSRSEIRDEKWHDCESAPMWLFGNYDYRVKPEERKPIRLEVWLYRDSVIQMECNEPNPETASRIGWRKVTVEVLPETETE